jgi:RNA polymerase sigma-70 factor (ECF subfamily)
MLSELTSANSLTEAPDSILIAASKRGQVSVFDVLVERYQARLFSVAFRITGNREDAEDVVQQSFQNAFVYLHTFEGKSSFATWLTRIGINQALMLRRSNRTLKTVSLQQTGSGQEGSSAAEIPDSSANPEELYAQQEAREILFGAMKKLNDGIQAALRLRLEERTIEETAHIMGVQVPTVKARLFRARERLRKRLLPVKRANEEMRSNRFKSA